MKIYMVSLLHRATINKPQHENIHYMVSLFHRATINNNRLDELLKLGPMDIRLLDCAAHLRHGVLYNTGLG